MLIHVDLGLGVNVGRMYRNPNVSVGLGLMYRYVPLSLLLTCVIW